MNPLSSYLKTALKYTQDRIQVFKDIRIFLMFLWFNYSRLYVIFSFLIKLCFTLYIKTQFQISYKYFRSNVHIILYFLKLITIYFEHIIQLLQNPSLLIVIGMTLIFFSQSFLFFSVGLGLVWYFFPLKCWWVLICNRGVSDLETHKAATAH